MARIQRVSPRIVFLGSSDGFNVIGSVLPISIPWTEWLVVSFDFGVRNDATTGRALDPVIPFTNAAESDLCDIVLDVTDIPFPAYSCTLWWRPLAAGSKWASGPNPSDAVVLGSMKHDATANTISRAQDFTQQPDSISTPTSIQSVVQDPLWDGVLSFSVRNNIPISPSVSSVALTASQIPFNTGWLGYHADMGRPVLDGITGFPTFVPELLEHGFHEGIWCTDAAWDPDDPRDIRGTVELPDTEGEIGDDIPALK